MSSAAKPAAPSSRTCGRAPTEVRDRTRAGGGRRYWGYSRVLAGHLGVPRGLWGTRSTRGVVQGYPGGTPGAPAGYTWAAMGYFGYFRGSLGAPIGVHKGEALLGYWRDATGTLVVSVNRGGTSGGTRVSITRYVRHSRGTRPVLTGYSEHTPSTRGVLGVLAGHQDEPP